MIIWNITKFIWTLKEPTCVYSSPKLMWRFGNRLSELQRSVLDTLAVGVCSCRKHALLSIWFVRRINKCLYIIVLSFLNDILTGNTLLKVMWLGLNWYSYASKSFRRILSRSTSPGWGFLSDSHYTWIAEPLK